jgi:outer membrane protein
MNWLNKALLFMLRILVSTVFFCAFALELNAQDNSIISFKDAVKIALQKNVTLNMQRNNLYLTEARRLQGFAAYLPGINAQGNFQRANGLQIDPTTGVGSNIEADNINGSVVASYTIFNGFNRSNTLRQSNSNLMAQTFLVKRTNQDVIFNVASQYLQVLLDQELLRIAEENRQTQQIILDQIKGFVQAGSRAEADQYTQEALFQNQKVTALTAKITLENDRALLAQTLQLDPSVPFQLVTPDWQADIGYFEELSIDSLYSIALANRADLKQQDYLVDGWKRSMRANSSGYYPTLAIFAGYASTYFASDAYRRTGGSPPASFHEQFVMNNPQTSYGLNLTIPIFDRLLTRTSRISSKVNYENAELVRENLFKTVKIDVQRSFKNFQTAIESYKTSLVQFQSGELALKVQQESYLLGVSNQVALAQANQAFVQGAASKAQAEVTLLFQKILLEYALGTLKIEDLP